MHAASRVHGKSL